MTNVTVKIQDDKVFYVLYVIQSMLCIILYSYLRGGVRPPSLSYCCHGISNSLQREAVDDKEVMRGVKFSNSLGQHIIAGEE